MAKDYKPVLKVAGAVVVGAALVVGAYSLGHKDVNALEDQTVSLKGEIMSLKDATVKAEAKAYAEGVASVEPKETIITKEVTKEVKVDNGNLKLVLDHIYDNDGDITYITEDLDDDEVSMIVDRIVLVNDFKAMALEAVKSDLFDELDGVSVNGTSLDDKDMEKLKLNDEANEISVDDIDFEDKDAELTVTGSFRQDDEKFDFEAQIIFRDGEYDDLDIVSVTKQ